MALGTALKSPCASGSWSDVRQYRFLCYSDIVPLLATEQLFERGGRLPFLDECEVREGQNCDEYPVVTMYFIRAAGWLSGDDYTRFYLVNAPDVAGLCRAGRGVPLCDERLARALLRAGAHAGDLRHHELGPARRGLRHPRSLLFLPKTGGGRRRRARGRRRGEALSGDAGAPPDRAASARSATRPGDRAGVVDRRCVALGEPAVRDRLRRRVVDVLPIQQRARRGLRQPLVHRVPPSGVLPDDAAP